MRPASCSPWPAGPMSQRPFRSNAELPQTAAGHSREHSTERRRRHDGRETTEMNVTTAFWYASRATGIVALLLLTAVLVLGILVNRQGRLPGLPRFAVTSL